MPPIDRSNITDGRGRHIPVARTKLPKKPQQVSEPTPRGAQELIDKLDQLAGRVRRLSPDRHDPERFHEERSGIARDLQRLAEKCRR